MRLLAIIFLSISVTVCAQNQHVVDSLTNRLEMDIHDTARIQVLMDLSVQFYGSDPWYRVQEEFPHVQADSPG